MKRLKVVIIILVIALIANAVLCLFKVIDSKIGMSISLLMLGVLNIIYAYNSFKNEKKMDAILFLMSSIFVIFVGLYTMYLYKSVG
ncbi:hypothetical protein [Clostridium ihumii]|uniref:hypothetical protein n=1 Tax=Clostridium ihumii TaxID=1470356 RepID=UPI000591213C|nr:hypothetical protein [Clostridium ihumii]